MERDKRVVSRRRTRLRSGKLARTDGTFLIDCVIHDRSSDGARLRVATSGSVPDRVLLFDDELSALMPAEVAWRSPEEIGIRFTANLVTSKTQAIARKLSGKYYAV